MNRRLTASLAVLLAAGVSVAPAQAATKKHPPIRKSYPVTLYPDPTPNATNFVPGHDGCGVLPQSQDKHPFTVPAAGVLKVVLDSPDPTGGKSPVGGTDWDLYVLESDGSIRTSSTSEFSHEEVIEPFRRKTPVTIWVCNLAGQPNGTVSLTFTYK